MTALSYKVIWLQNEKGTSSGSINCASKQKAIIGLGLMVHLFHFLLLLLVVWIHFISIQMCFQACRRGRRGVYDNLGKNSMVGVSRKPCVTAVASTGTGSPGQNAGTRWWNKRQICCALELNCVQHDSFTFRKLPLIQSAESSDI